MAINMTESGLFFDTSSINKALDTGAQSIEVASCPQVLIELAVTSRKNPVRAKALCETFYRLVGRRIVRPATELAKLEVECFTLKTPFPGVFYDEARYQSFVKPILTELCEGKFDGEHVKPYLDKIPADKKQQLNFIKNKIGIDLTETATSFETMVEEIPEEHLIYLTQRAMSDWNISASDDSCRFLLQNRNTFPHFWVSVVLPFAVMYLYRTNKQIKPKWGINYDMTIIMNSTAFPIFVCDDKDSRELHHILFPQKRVLRYEELDYGSLGSENPGSRLKI